MTGWGFCMLAGIRTVCDKSISLTSFIQLKHFVDVIFVI